LGSALAPTTHSIAWPLAHSLNNGLDTDRSTESSIPRSGEDATTTGHKVLDADSLSRVRYVDAIAAELSRGYKIGNVPRPVNVVDSQVKAKETKIPSRACARASGIQHHGASGSGADGAGGGRRQPPRAAEPVRAAGGGPPNRWRRRGARAGLPHCRRATPIPATSRRPPSSGRRSSPGASSRYGCLLVPVSVH
jgi:hypothetical protein